MYKTLYMGIIFIALLIFCSAWAQTNDTVYVFGGSPLGESDTVIVIINTSIGIPILLQTPSDSTFAAELYYPFGINNCYFESFDTAACQYSYPLDQWDYADFDYFENDNWWLAHLHGTDNECTWDSYTFMGFANLEPPFDNPYLHTEPGEPPLHCLTFRVDVADDPALHDQVSCNAIGFGYEPLEILDPQMNALFVIESYACYHFLYRTWITGTVTDENNQPVENALVWIAGTESYDTTGANGSYSLSHDEPGIFSIAAFKLGYTFNIMSGLQFPSGDTADIDIGLESFDGYYYLVGDANMNAGNWPPQVDAADITYLVNYFRHFPTNPPCNFDNFWASADVTGDCRVLGNDITRMVGYLGGIIDLSYCQDYNPAWYDEDECPDIAIPGWPGCE